MRKMKSGKCPFCGENLKRHDEIGKNAYKEAHLHCAQEAGIYG